MRPDPILKSAQPSYRDSHRAPKAGGPRRTTDTASDLFPARTRPRSTRTPSSSSMPPLRRPSSLRNSISSSSIAAPSNEVPNANPSSSEAVSTPTASSSKQPAWPSNDSTQAPPPRPRSTSNPTFAASDVWKVRYQAEALSNQRLKKNLENARESIKSHRAMITTLQEKVEELEEAQRQMRRGDGRSLYSESSNTRRYRWQQKVQMIKDDFRGHKVVQRMRRRGKSADPNVTPTRPLPKRAFLSSSMG